MKFLRNCICIVLFLLGGIANLSGEVWHTFSSNLARVYCGQPSKSEIVNLNQVVDVNDEFAVALGWTISPDGRTRYYYYECEVTVGGLDYPPHNGTGGGYNQTGFQLIINRDSNGAGKYSYSFSVKNVYPNSPCVDNE